MSYWLPRVCAHPDVSSEVLAWAHESMKVLPEHVAKALWPCGVSVRDFPWDHECGDGRPWKDVGGYWSSETMYAMVNAAYCKTPETTAAVVLHELGHGLSIDVLPKPHRDAAFRAAWSTGRKRVKQRYPSDYEAYEGLGVFCGHWTQAVQEVWAEGFAWIFGARIETHPAFADVFHECVALVSAEIDTLSDAGAEVVA